MIKSIEVYLVTDNNGLEAVEFYKRAPLKTKFLKI